MQQTKLIQIWSIYFCFSPPPNLFQQLYQILTDFDIRFYMYELLKVSGIVMAVWMGRLGMREAVVGLTGQCY